MDENRFVIPLILFAHRQHVAALLQQIKFAEDRIKELETVAEIFDGDELGCLRDEVEGLRDLIANLQGVA